MNVIPSGSLRLDIALRIGGIPCGVICEISGPVSSGKTTLSQHIIAEAQSMGEICAFIDVDHTFDIKYAARCGVNLERLIVAEPMNAEEALEIAETLCTSEATGVIVVDSINNLISSFEIKGSITPRQGSLVDKMLSHSLQNLSPIIRKSNTALIFTNRNQPQKETAYHGLKRNPARLALKLHAGLRLQMKTLDFIHDNDKIIGQKVLVKIVKNTLAPFFDATELVIMYNVGIRKTGDIFNLGTELGIIHHQGNTIDYKDVPLGTGRQKAMQFLERNPALEEEIEQVIRQRLLPPG